MAALVAIMAGAAHAQPGREPRQVAGQAKIGGYHTVFQECHKGGGAPWLAIRRMEIDGADTLLLVDPASLVTQIARDQDWSCADTDDAHQNDTRYLRAIRAAAVPQAGASHPAVVVDGGIARGTESGSFVTADLCPSRRPLDRAFLEKLQAAHAPLPVAFALSGLWLLGHRADFQWLRDRERGGALRITWVDHSYDHPYVPGRALAENFLLEPGVDMRAEVLDTERLLIANGETPSVFFRFPGLISSAALMHMVADDHLIVLGAGAWLAQTPRARPGDIILIHLNGNEPAGLNIFSKLLADDKLPLPFRPIDEAP